MPSQTAEIISVNKDFEILLKYNSRDVLVSDQYGTTLTEFKCKRNHFFSNYYSGKSQIDNHEYSIACDSKAITLLRNDQKVGDVRIVVKDAFYRLASIQFNDERFGLIRKDLKQMLKSWTQMVKSFSRLPGSSTKTTEEFVWINLFR